MSVAMRVDEMSGFLGTPITGVLVEGTVVIESFELLCTQPRVEPLLVCSAGNGRP